MQSPEACSLAVYCPCNTHVAHAHCLAAPGGEAGQSQDWQGLGAFTDPLSSNPPSPGLQPAPPLVSKAAPCGKDVFLHGRVRSTCCHACGSGHKARSVHEHGNRSDPPSFANLINAPGDRAQSGVSPASSGSGRRRGSVCWRACGHRRRRGGWRGEAAGTVHGWLRGGGRGRRALPHAQPLQRWRTSGGRCEHACVVLVKVVAGAAVGIPTGSGIPTDLLGM